MWHHICFSQTGCNSRERSLALIPIFIHMWPFSWKSHELFGPKKPSVKLHSACFEKLIFIHVSNVRKTERVAKFDGFIGPWHCETIKGNCGTHNRPEKVSGFLRNSPLGGEIQRWQRMNRTSIPSEVWILRNTTSCLTTWLLGFIISKWSVVEQRSLGHA